MIPMMNETAIVSVVQQAMMTSSFRVALAVFLSRWLIFFYPILLIALVLKHTPKARHAILEVGWSVIAALLTTSLIASLVGRIRPFLAESVFGSPIVGLIPNPLNTSFPSGHTSASFAIAAAIFSADRFLGGLAFGMAILIAFGRMAVGVHYPTDLFGGVFVGLGSFAFVRFCHRQLRRKDLRGPLHHHP